MEEGALRRAFSPSIFRKGSMYNEHFYDKDQTMRHDALEMALNNSQMGAKEDAVIKKAAAFEDYIKTGAKPDDNADS
jgi:hypothetical protein